MRAETGAAVADLGIARIQREAPEAVGDRARHHRDVAGGAHCDSAGDRAGAGERGTKEPIAAAVADLRVVAGSQRLPGGVASTGEGAVSFFAIAADPPTS